MSLIRSFGVAGSLVALVALASIGACSSHEIATEPGCTVTPTYQSVELTIGGAATVPVVAACAGMDRPQVRWTSLDTTIVVVDSLTGLATGRRLGATSVRVGIVGVPSAVLTIPASVGCPAIPLIGPTMVPAVSVIPVGASVALHVSFAVSAGPPTCATLRDSAFVWASLDTSIATVDSLTGVVTGRRVGQAVVKATSIASRNVTGSVVVTVTASGGFYDPPNVSPSNLLLVVGQTETLTVVVPTPPTLPPDVDRGALFRSSDPCVASVSPDGVVTGHYTGNATVLVMARRDTNIRTTIGASVAPPRIVLPTPTLTTAAGTAVDTGAVRGTVTVTVGRTPIRLPNGGRLDVLLGGRVLATRDVPTVPVGEGVLLTVDVPTDARDASGARLVPNGPTGLEVRLFANAITTPPPGCVPFLPVYINGVSLTLANP